MTHPGSLYFGEWLDAADAGDDLAIADLRDDFQRSVRSRKVSALDYKSPMSLKADLKFRKACSEAFETLEAAAEIYIEYALPGACSEPTV